MPLISSLAAALILMSPQVADQANTATTTGITETSPETQTETTGASTVQTEPREEVVCQTRAPTGSRLNQRRCRTRSVATAQGRLAQDALDQLRPGPSTDAILNSPTYTPQ